MDGKALCALYRNGVAVHVKIKRTRDDGSADKPKTQWQECWHVRGKIPQGKRQYDFTVCLRGGKAYVYDFSMQKKLPADRAHHTSRRKRNRA